jgi:hypothetical protein
MTLALLLLTLTLSSPIDARSVADTVKAPKPPPLAPTAQRGKPNPPPPPKGKPAGQPELKRRKPPLDY